jgi:hypothetical protein
MTATVMTYPNRTKCPICDQWVCSGRSTGKLRHHGPKRSPCPTSGRRIDEVSPQPAVTGEMLAALRHCWRVGDSTTVAEWLGETCPPYVPVLEHAGCPDCELIGLIEHARQWITRALRDKGIATYIASPDAHGPTGGVS